VSARIHDPLQAEALKHAIRERKNIVVVGGTSSGKTTLLNALLAEIADAGDRVVLLEDTRRAAMRRPGLCRAAYQARHRELADLVRSTLRLRPDRIIVGEVARPEALDMLKAWNTGHPGGLTTVHANSAASALLRLEQLIQEAVVTVPRDLIVQAIDIVVFLGGRGSNRRVETVAEVSGLDSVGNYIPSRSVFPPSPGRIVREQR